MNVVTTIARVLLGLVFVLAGASAFAFTNPPHFPGLAGAFNDAFVRSHWSMFVGAAQLVLGLLLLVNRFVVVALIMLAAFLYNSLAFHITMMPSGLPMAIVVALLWFLVSWSYRQSFRPLFTAAPNRSEAAANVRSELTGLG
jgi:putative oxidoreductase